MRALHKSESYFLAFIPDQERRKNKFIQAYEDHKDKWDSDTIRDNFSTIFRYSLHKLIAQYSSGNSIIEIAETYRESIGYIEKSWKKESGYVQMLWMLSIGILLKIDDAEFNRMVALVDEQQLQDYLIDYVIAFRHKDRLLSASLVFDVPYKGIAEATKMEKAEAQLRIKKYLEKEWYKGHRDSYWYNHHKSEFDIFFGYWSFDTAAITAIMDLDDTIFRDNQYYPKDLVDYFREK